MDRVVFLKNLIELQGDLLRYAFRLTGNREEACDLQQETSLKALDNLVLYQENTNFKGWLFTVMKNLFINGYRKSRRMQTSTDNTEDQYIMTLYQADNPFASDSACLYSEINQMVNKLPADYKTPFKMYVRGYKYREIALELSLPLGTIKSRIYFSRQQLQAQLKDYI